MSPEPVRLLELGDLSRSERALLEAGREGVPVVYDVEAGAARLRASLAALATAGAVATVHGAAGAVRGSATVGSKALLTSLAAKILLGAAAGTALFTGGIAIGTRMAQRPTVALATAPLAPVAAVAATAPAAHGALAGSPQEISAASMSNATAARATSTEAPAAEASPAAGASSRRAVPDRLERGAHAGASGAVAVPAAARTAESSESTIAAASVVAAPAPLAAAPAPVAAPAPTALYPVAAAPAANDSLGELRALAVARNLVDRDPDAALTALDTMRKDYPRGYFVEERQALTVLALAGAGRSSAARQQAVSFLRVFPNGPFSERVRAVLDPSK